MSEKRELQAFSAAPVQSRVAEMVMAGDLAVKPGYNVENALRQAEIVIKEKGLDRKCDPASIMKALFAMIVEGMYPGQKQCHFIDYGGRCVYQRGLDGDIAVAVRDAGVVDVSAREVYENDVLETEIINGRLTITRHSSNFTERGKLSGAYAVVFLPGGATETTLMDMDQIKMAWDKSKSKKREVHAQFPGEMAKRTVIRRALKRYVNSATGNERKWVFEASASHQELIEVVNRPLDEPRSLGGPVVFDQEPESQLESQPESWVDTENDDILNQEVDF